MNANRVFLDPDISNEDKIAWFEEHDQSASPDVVFKHQRSPEHQTVINYLIMNTDLIEQLDVTGKSPQQGGGMDVHTPFTYCVSCKAKTETIDPSSFVSKNGRNMMRGTCGICDKRKTSF